MSQPDAPGHHENWSDQEFVSEWIDKQRDRESVRSEQFALFGGFKGEPHIPTPDQRDS